MRICQISANAQSDVSCTLNEYHELIYVNGTPRLHITAWMVDGHSASHLTRWRRRDASKLHDIIEILQPHHTTN